MFSPRAGGLPKEKATARSTTIAIKVLRAS